VNHPYLAVTASRRKSREFPEELDQAGLSLPHRLWLKYWYEFIGHRESDDAVFRDPRRCRNCRVGEKTAADRIPPQSPASVPERAAMSLTGSNVETR